MVVHAAQHDNADPVLTLQLIERLPCLTANVSLAIVQGLESSIESTFILFTGKSQDRTPRLQHLVGADSFVLQVENGININHPVLSEDVALLGERGLYYFWRSSHCRASVGPGQVNQRSMQHVVHGEPDSIQRFLVMLRRDQVINVRNADL